MNESKLRAEVGQSLQRLWFRTYTPPDMSICPRCGTEIYPRGGTPDMMFWDWKGPVGFIEFKVYPPPTHGDWYRTSFSLSKISPEQRAWLLFAQETGAFHLYIGLGTAHGRAGRKEEPRLAWIVPWAYWQSVEEKLLPIQKSLPLVVRPGLDRRVQDGHLVAMELLKNFELRWVGGGWQLPTNHPITQARARPVWRGVYEQDLRAARKRWSQIREEQREIWQTTKR
jgi:hypothetical protein